jgi:hypothetical protein
MRLAAVGRPSTETTGVPSKNYRGPQQKLPGSPAKTTGVPSKNYRGPQQTVEEFILQSPKFFALSGVSLYCCFYMLFTTTGKEREGVTKVA